MIGRALDAPKRPVARRHAAAAFSLLLAMSVLALVPSHRATAANAKTGKLSPRLVTLAAGAMFASPRAEAKALSLPQSGFGSLVTRPDGRVLVYIRTTDTSPDGVANLRTRGAQIVNVSPEYSTVTAAVAPGALQGVAADPAVDYVMEVLAPHIGAVDRADAAAAANAASPNVCAPTVSEGDSAMNVASARTNNSVNGSGQTIGILSDSFDAAAGTATTAAQDVAHGDLPGAGNPCGHPTPVNVLQDGSSGQTDEGRAMAQLAHDLAPGATLAFATAENGETAFASAITALRTQAHATVIADDVGYPNEPFFQDGPVANAARAATAAGVSYFTAAGNANVIVSGNNVGSYEAPSYRGGACPTFTNLGYSVLDCHDFDPGAGVDTTDSITVAPGGGFDLDLQWAQARGAVSDDYDLFVVNGSGTILAGSAIDNTSAQQPIEFLGWANTSASPQTVRIVIARFSGSAPVPLKFVFVDSGGITGVEHNTSSGGDTVGPGIFGHAGTSEVGSTAAIPYNDANTSEDFSSRGPVTHYFQPVPSTTALGSPEVVNKPDFAATDGVRTSFFAEQVAGVWRFYGTSAATPQAAAIGALLRSKNALLTPAEVITTLHDTARAVANDGTADVVGGGYLDASAALAAVDPIAGPPTAVAGTPGDGQVTVHWSAPASDGGIPITGYQVTPAINGVAQAPLTFNSTATSQTIGGLPNGTGYTFTVATLDANGPGPESAPSATVNVGAPTKPTGVNVIATGDSQVTLQWTAPASANGAPITGYVITAKRLSDDIDATFPVGAVSSTTITQLSNGYAYTFRIVATNSRGNGEPSDATAPFTVGIAGQVTNVAASPGNASATVTFKAPAPNGTHITGYNIVVYEGSTLFDGQNYSTATKQIVQGLVNGQPFKFQVRALTNGGQGPPSPFSQPITAGAPTAPGAPRVTPGNGRAVLHWTAAAANGAAIKKFVVTPIVNGVARPSRAYAADTTSATITGLPNGKSFRFGIRATNARGTGPQAIAPTVVIGAPTAPTNVAAKPGKGRATIHWQAPNANGSPITGYTITPYHHGTKLTAHVFKSTATQQTITGLTPGSGWTFVVAATNRRGTGPPSTPSKSVVIT